MENPKQTNGNIAAIEDYLTARVRAEVRRLNTSQKSTAARIGISQTAFNQWLNGIYKGSKTNLEHKIKRWLETESQHGQTTILPLPDYIATHTGKRIGATLAFAQAAHELVVVYGGAGMGKTRTAQHYAAKHSNAWITTITPASSSMLATLEKIAVVLGIKPSGRRCAVVEAEILERLKDTDGLLIVDEAQHLRIQVIEQIRSIFDAAGATGLAIMGNDTIYSRLTGGIRAASFAQMFSRISKRVHLRRPADSDVAALGKALNVTGSKERSLLEKIAQRPGALRGVVQTIRLASALAQGDIDADHIRRAWRELTEQPII